ncbi:helix-turn-helix domain-containing protein [Nonomuraea recticatena]|uniref:Resolvase HTH domain-containing protein n=1 Tax=Nonomuraea recticatena TaxID=46178 RepID=A0ABP6ELG8_9ACTN
MRTPDGLATAHAHGRTGGRPPALDAAKPAAARARQERGESITAIAKHLGVGRFTLYRVLEEQDRPAAATTKQPAPAPMPSKAEDEACDAATYAARMTSAA